MKRLFVASLALFAAACASTTPMIEKGSVPTAVATRFSEEKISANRYRVNYIAPPSMPAAQVKEQALLGAAKLTLNKGNEWFEVADQAVGAHQHSLEIVMGKGEALAGGSLKTYDAKELVAELGSGKTS